MIFFIHWLTKRVQLKGYYFPKYPTGSFHLPPFEKHSLKPSASKTHEEPRTTTHLAHGVSPANKQTGGPVKHSRISWAWEILSIQYFPYCEYHTYKRLRWAEWWQGTSWLQVVDEESQPIPTLWEYLPFLYSTNNILHEKGFACSQTCPVT